MNITIKNYRSIEDTKIKITKNKINYLLGGNESGKSNVLNAIRIPDLNNQDDLQVTQKDVMIINGNFTQDPIEVIVEDNDAINSFPSTGPNRVSWFYEKSKNKEKYNSIIENNLKNKMDEWINEINSKFSNNEIDEETKNNIKSYLSKLEKGQYVNLEQRKEIEGIVPNFKDTKIELEAIISKMSIDYPIVKYVEPIIRAKQKDKISYPYDSLFQEESTLRNICEKFLDQEEKEIIPKLKEQIEDTKVRNSYRHRLFDKLNEKVKEYFQQFHHIRAFPKFRSEQSEVILDVISKDSWAIDSGDENERSLGYKSFLRIVTELIAAKSSNNEILYIIDEPEQSLHPYLQIELVKTMQNVLENSKNLSILLVTHSPYMIHYNKDFKLHHTSFIERDQRGASIIKNIGNEEHLIYHLKKYKKNQKTQTSYLFKILRDSLVWQKEEEKVSKKIDQLQVKLDTKEIDANKFLQEITSSWEFENIN